MSNPNAAVSSLHRHTVNHFIFCKCVFCSYECVKRTQSIAKLKVCRQFCISMDLMDKCAFVLIKSCWTVSRIACMREVRVQKFHSKEWDAITWDKMVGTAMETNLQNEHKRKHMVRTAFPIRKPIPGKYFLFSSIY